jgi:hypothetical protein
VVMMMMRMRMMMMMMMRMIAVDDDEEEEKKEEQDDPRHNVWTPVIMPQGIMLTNIMITIINPAGSWRPEKQLELWDYTTGNLIESVPWTYTSTGQSQACMLYAAQFSKVR